MNFKDKIIYEIYIKSFKDSDGNGVGDIRGITSKLDYLKDLGVDLIWITPFFCSPLKDNGYDISDYYSIDPLFGTMADFKELVSEAEKRSIGIMLDMVFNHTSTEHEWFKRALNKEEKYMNYYIFSDKPTNWVSKFGGGAWKYVENLDRYYLHLFDETQADLNWDNPDVREELKKIIRFWKEIGVKGFRFDVINLISKPEVFEDDLIGDGRRFYSDGKKVNAYLKELIEDTGIADYCTIGEMSSTDLSSCVEYSKAENRELSMVFNFHHLKIDYQDKDKWKLMKPDVKELKDLFSTWQMTMQKENGWNALFWCNHDQPRAVSRFGNDRYFWKRSAKMLAILQYLMRGTPVLYQGEELGQTNAYFSDLSQYRDVESINYYQILIDQGMSQQESLHILSERSRDNGRTQMLWDDSSNNGFSDGKPWIEYVPAIRKANVKDEEMDDDSILNFYKKLIRYRKSRNSLIYGSIDFIETIYDNIFVYTRKFDQEETLVISNFTEKIAEMEIDLKDYKIVLSNMDGMEYKNGILTLREYEAMVLERI